MPFHDLNLSYISNHKELAHTLNFLGELDYSTVAITTSVTGKIPNEPTKIPLQDITIPASLHALSRITVTISDASQNHRLNLLTPIYDLVALRPTNEKALQLCCNSLECDLISLDLSQRLLYPIRFKTVASALQRTIRFEICYSPGITGGNDARRNLIGGAASLIRATRGRGIILSSDAKNALGLRAPWDVINLAQVWGLNRERAKEAICDEAGKVVRIAKMKRTSFRGVVDIIQDGSHQNQEVTSKLSRQADNAGQTTTSTSPVPASPQVEPLKNITVLPNELKRKASLMSGQPESKAKEKPLSKRELKRREKRARLEKAAGAGGGKDKDEPTKIKADFPIKHESLHKSQKNG